MSIIFFVVGFGSHCETSHNESGQNLALLSKQTARVRAQARPTLTEEKKFFHTMCRFAAAFYMYFVIQKANLGVTSASRMPRNCVHNFAIRRSWVQGNPGCLFSTIGSHTFGPWIIVWPHAPWHSALAWRHLLCSHWQTIQQTIVQRRNQAPIDNRQFKYICSRSSCHTDTILWSSVR